MSTGVPSRPARRVGGGQLCLNLGWKGLDLRCPDGSGRKRSTATFAPRSTRWPRKLPDASPSSRRAKARTTSPGARNGSWNLRPNPPTDSIRAEPEISAFRQTPRHDRPTARPHLPSATLVDYHEGVPLEEPWVRAVMATSARPCRRPGDRDCGRRNAQSTHSMLCRGPASSIRRISSSVTGGGAAPGSSTGVQTSRNQPSIPAGV